MADETNDQVIEAPKFEPKWLKGLKYRSAETKTVTGESGRPTRKCTPTERALREKDVLDWKDNGDHVMIVTADGRKYKVEK